MNDTNTEMTINWKSHNETGWKRVINFTHEGNEYEVLLFWDEFQGYELIWRSENGEFISKTPEWAVNWDENAHEGMTLEWYLDEQSGREML